MSSTHITAASVNVTRILAGAVMFKKSVIELGSLRHVKALPEPLRSDALRMRCAQAEDLIGTVRSELQKVILNGSCTPKERAEALQMDVEYTNALSRFRALLAEVNLAVAYTPHIDRPADIDAVEIHGVREIAPGIHEIEKERPSFFSVFLRDIRGIAIPAGDFGTPRLAMMHAKDLAARYAWKLADLAIDDAQFKRLLAA